MKKRITLRILLDIILAISIIEGWWFVAVCVSVLGLWYMSLYGVEVVIAGVGYDALFGSLPDDWIRGYTGTISAIALLAIISLSKKVIRR